MKSRIRRSAAPSTDLAETLARDEARRFPLRWTLLGAALVSIGLWLLLAYVVGGVFR